MLRSRRSTCLCYTRVWALFLANIPHWSPVYAVPARPFNQPIVPDALMCVRIPPYSHPSALALTETGQ